ncbi:MULTISPECIES: sigma factor [unclassified Nocardioides]|uniref:sigma factor n=1 Tax=unclassified Nocardioides TaxID=2615069 RepID=UPI0009F0E522|nr:MULTISPECIES: sigma factor [unclassified Nocardioides]GAW51634.1 RNA polymerase sigma factor SigK [Nocardioides sp. PD653-B2]GAW56807.1 RNA polymerase sigma factor SigK [Nocardioides sp. PD653]
MLVQRSAAGDEAAFAAIYDATAPLVLGLALGVLRNPVQAEEVAEEAYLQVWTRCARFDPAQGSVITWILTIVHHRAVSRRRSSEGCLERDVHSRGHRSGLRTLHAPRSAR